jgi:hypothetical protein
MDDSRAERMDEEELAAFLGPGGTGVISFPKETDEAPHSVPVSYGYDEASGHFYFRLAVGQASEKPIEPESTAPVSFVTYDSDDGHWRSVVAAGRLEPVEEADVSEGILEELRRVEIPLYDVFDRHTKETTFLFFRLDPDRLTGRAEAPPGN